MSAIFEMDVIKFRYNTMVCGCATKKNFNLWCDKIKLWNKTGIL